LQLKHYVVSEISVSANKEFDPDKPVKLTLQDIVGEPECSASDENPREWQIVLRLKHSQNTESNSPYFFMIELVGFFGVEEALAEDKIELFLKVNGSSVLYSTGREVLRSVMSMGPFLPIMLPTACFYDPKPKAECEECAPKKNVAKGAPAKKAIRKRAAAKKATSPSPGPRC